MYKTFVIARYEIMGADRIKRIRYEANTISCYRNVIASVIFADY